MKNILMRIRQWEFEARIFVSFSIVLVVCALAFIVFEGTALNSMYIGHIFGLSQEASGSIGYFAAALVMIVASLLRMWAGSVLTSDRMMAFEVQADSLLTIGPYRVVRNPIYLADLIAMCGFALCLPPVGVLLPGLMYIHYRQIVNYEERSLSSKFGKSYDIYALRIPRLIPSAVSLRNIGASIKEFRLNRDGVRHNSVYLLFVVGFVVSAFTHEFLHAVLIGVPAVLDWAIIHTKKGVARQGQQRWDRFQPPPSVKSNKKKVFQDILYAQCWEDPSLDRKAFNIQPDDVVFSITSGGCNTLTFLLDQPAKVIALDISPYQNYLLELKIAAFKTLAYDELLEFIGVRGSNKRTRLYERVRTALREESRDYWDRQNDKIELGIIHCGRYEAYMAMLRRWLQRLMGRSTIERFFELDDPTERREYYETHWNNFWWRLFTRVLLSRTTMTVLFDKAFFAHLDTTFSFGKHFAEKVKNALTELPVKDNYFLSYILLGNYYDERHLPPYLRRENYGIIRKCLDRVEIVVDDCTHFFSTLPSESISKFNFTNIFEWMSLSDYEKLLRNTVRVARHKAIITYRNLLVFRERPESLANTIYPHRAQAKVLLNVDLSFIYSNYVVEEIDKEGVPCDTVSGKLQTVKE